VPATAPRNVAAALALAKASLLGPARVDAFFRTSRSPKNCTGDTGRSAAGCN